MAKKNYRGYRSKNLWENESFFKGMNFTDEPLSDGLARALVNFDISKTGGTLEVRDPFYSSAFKLPEHDLPQSLGKDTILFKSVQDTGQEYLINIGKDREQSNNPTKTLDVTDIYVIDGDTFESGGKRYRLLGIDAIELDEETGQGIPEKEALQSYFNNGLEVKVTYDFKADSFIDTYDRHLVWLFIDDVNINVELLKDSSLDVKLMGAYGDGEELHFPNYSVKVPYNVKDWDHFAFPTDQDPMDPLSADNTDFIDDFSTTNITEYVENNHPLENYVEGETLAIMSSENQGDWVVFKVDLDEVIETKNFEEIVNDIIGKDVIEGKNVNFYNIINRTLNVYAKPDQTTLTGYQESGKVPLPTIELESLIEKINTSQVYKDLDIPFGIPLKFEVNNVTYEDKENKTEYKPWVRFEDIDGIVFLGKVYANGEKVYQGMISIKYYIPIEDNKVKYEDSQFKVETYKKNVFQVKYEEVNSKYALNLLDPNIPKKRSFIGQEAEDNDYFIHSIPTLSVLNKNGEEVSELSYDKGYTIRPNYVLPILPDFQNYDGYAVKWEFFIKNQEYSDYDVIYYRDLPTVGKSKTLYHVYENDIKKTYIWQNDSFVLVDNPETMKVFDWTPMFDKNGNELYSDGTPEGLFKSTLTAIGSEVGIKLVKFLTEADIVDSPTPLDIVNEGGGIYKTSVEHREQGQDLKLILKLVDEFGSTISDFTWLGIDFISNDGRQQSIGNLNPTQINTSDYYELTVPNADIPKLDVIYNLLENSVDISEQDISKYPIIDVDFKELLGSPGAGLTWQETWNALFKNTSDISDLYNLMKDWIELNGYTDNNYLLRPVSILEVTDLNLSVVGSTYSSLLFEPDTFIGSPTDYNQAGNLNLKIDLINDINNNPNKYKDSVNSNDEITIKVIATDLNSFPNTVEEYYTVILTDYLAPDECDTGFINRVNQPNPFMRYFRVINKDIDKDNSEIYKGEVLRNTDPGVDYVVPGDITHFKPTIKSEYIEDVIEASQGRLYFKVYVAPFRIVDNVISSELSLHYEARMSSKVLTIGNKEILETSYSHGQDLQNCRGITKYQGRLVLYDNPKNATTIYISDIGGNISYFPLKKALDQFYSPIIHVQPVQQGLIVFTADDVYLVYESQMEDSVDEFGNITPGELFFVAKVIYSNLTIKPHNRNTVRGTGQDILFMANNSILMLRPNPYVQDISNVFLEDISSGIKDLLENPKIYLEERIPYYGIDPLNIEEINVDKYVIIRNKAFWLYISIDIPNERPFTIIAKYNRETKPYHWCLYETRAFAFPYDNLNSNPIEGPHILVKNSMDIDGGVTMLMHEALNLDEFVENYGKVFDISTVRVVNGSFQYWSVDLPTVEDYENDEEYAKVKQPLFCTVDTGYMNIATQLLKRFRRFYAELYNLDGYKLPVYIDFNIDGRQRQVSSSARVTSSGGTLQYEVKAIPNTALLDIWELDNDELEAVKKFKVNIGISGRGRNPQVKLTFKATGKFRLYKYGIIYKEQDAN